MKVSENCNISYYYYYYYYCVTYFYLLFPNLLCFCLVRKCPRHQGVMYMCGSELYIFVTDLCVYILVTNFVTLISTYEAKEFQMRSSMTKARDLGGAAGTLWLVSPPPGLTPAVDSDLWCECSWRFKPYWIFLLKKGRLLYVSVSFWEKKKNKNFVVCFCVHLF